MIDYGNSEIRAVIEEYVHKERDRNLLIRRYCFGVCYEPLAEEFEMSVRQAQNIVYKYEPIIFKHLEKSTLT